MQIQSSFQTEVKIIPLLLVSTNIQMQSIKIEITFILLDYCFLIESNFNFHVRFHLNPLFYLFVVYVTMQSMISMQTHIFTKAN